VGNIFALIKLVRTHNCIIAAVGVWLGAYLADAEPFNINVLLASLTAALVCGAGNAVNDLVDIDIDRKTHPARPLAKGDLPAYSALLVAVIFTLFAITLSLLTNWKVLAAVLIASIFLLLYNFTLKKTPLWGNLVISFLSGLTFLVGGLAVDAPNILTPPGPIIPAIFAVLFHLGREWLKDINDVEADRNAGFKTMPIVFSFRFVLILTTLLYFLLIFLTVLPAAYRWYSWIYGYLVILLVDIPLLLMLIYLWVSKNRLKYQISGKFLKLLMAVGLIVFILGKNYNFS
jgi:geranylgeranylglycerol-phosphate geranylgeranyltransferase